MDAASIAVIVVAVIMSIPGILSFLSGRRKDKASVSQILVGTATGLVTSMNKRLLDLEENEVARESELEDIKAKVVDMGEKMGLLERNNYILCEGRRLLIRQVRRSGYEPVFDIDEALCESMNGDSES